MAFTDMNDVEQELGEEKPPERNGNRTFLIIAGTLAGIFVLALLCIGGLALFRFLPNQRATQDAAAATAAHSTAIALSASQTAAIPTATVTMLPTYTQTATVRPTNTPRPTNTAILIVAPTNSPTFDPAIATRNTLLTQIAATHMITTQQATATLKQPTPTLKQPTLTLKPPTATLPHPTTTALPTTGFAEELGTPGLMAAAFVLLAIIFLVRRLRASS
jgi:hypothetical protein